MSDDQAFEVWCESVRDCGHVVQPNSATARQRKLGWDAAIASKKLITNIMTGQKQPAGEVVKSVFFEQPVEWPLAAMKAAYEAAERHNIHLAHCKKCDGIGSLNRYGNDQHADCSECDGRGYLILNKNDDRILDPMLAACAVLGKAPKRESGTPHGYEIMGDTIYIGPMRPDRMKVADIVCTIDWDETYTEEAKAKRIQNAERICALLGHAFVPGLAYDYCHKCGMPEADLSTKIEDQSNG